MNTENTVWEVSLCPVLPYGHTWCRHIDEAVGPGDFFASREGMVAGLLQAIRNQRHHDPKPFDERVVAEAAGKCEPDGQDGWTYIPANEAAFPDTDRQQLAWDVGGFVIRRHAVKP